MDSACAVVTTIVPIKYRGCHREGRRHWLEDRADYAGPGPPVVTTMVHHFSRVRRDPRRRSLPVGRTTRAHGYERGRDDQCLRSFWAPDSRLLRFSPNASASSAGGSAESPTRGANRTPRVFKVEKRCLRGRGVCALRRHGPGCGEEAWWWREGHGARGAHAALGSEQMIVSLRGRRSRRPIPEPGTQSWESGMPEARASTSGHRAKFSGEFISARARTARRPQAIEASQGVRWFGRRRRESHRLVIPEFASGRWPLGWENIEDPA